MSRSTRYTLAAIAVIATATGVVVGLVASKTPAALPVIDNVPMSVSLTHTAVMEGEETQVCSSSRYVAEQATQALLFGGQATMRVNKLGPLKTGTTVMNSGRTVEGGIVWYQNAGSSKTLCAYFTAPRPGTYQIAFMHGDEILEIDNFASVTPPS